MAQSLFNRATSGKNVAAAIFWMKARAGWRGKNELHVSLANQELEQMSDEELQKARLAVNEATREEVIREMREECSLTEGQGSDRGSDPGASGMFTTDQRPLIGGDTGPQGDGLHHERQDGL